MNSVHDIGDISDLSSNQVDGLHQQVIVEVLVDVEEKIHAHFPLSEGKNQSGEVEDEVFEAFCFLFDLHVVEGREMRGRIVIPEVYFRVNHFFCVDQLMGLFSNVVKCNRLCFPFFIFIMMTKNPHVSEVKEVSHTVRIFLFHFHSIGVIVEGKVDLADGS